MPSLSLLAGAPLLHPSPHAEANPLALPKSLAIPKLVRRAARVSRPNCSTSPVAEPPRGIPAEIALLLTPDELEILKKNETPNLNKVSTRKWNPIHTFALSEQIKFMDHLFEYGLHIDAIDKDGYTALHKAVIGNKEVVINHLLRKGANPHVKDMNGATPLHYAVHVGAIPIVKLLIKYKVDVNVADNEGWTPLHIAIQTRSRDIAKILLINGADATRRNKDGKLALDIAVCYGRDFKSYELAKLLKFVPTHRVPDYLYNEKPPPPS